MNRESVSFKFLLGACLVVMRPVSAAEPRSPVRAEKPIKIDRRGEKGFSGLFTMDRDGSNVQFLAAAPGMLMNFSPEWSRDGTKIIFSAIPEIDAFPLGHNFVMTVRGQDRGKIDDLGIGCGPTWSPDGRQIAFTMYSDVSAADAGVWIMNADGTGRKRFCEGWYPRWSPDGREICVNNYSGKTSTLVCVDVMTRHARNVLEDDISVVGSVTWSPDGKRIVFAGTMEKRVHILVIDADGSRDSLAILYSQDNGTGVPLGTPAWSPDGREVVFPIQDHNVKGDSWRRLHRTYLYTISAEIPTKPRLIEPKKVGRINAGMMWSPDSRQIIFSSER